VIPRLWTLLQGRDWHAALRAMAAEGLNNMAIAQKLGVARLTCGT
jgi:hypothetical protein